MTFTRAYTMGSMVGAVCLPSRTMLLTGKSWLRIPKAKEGDPATLLPKVLNAAGYETFHVGKGGNEYTAGIQAFDQNIVMEDGGPKLRAGSSQRHADAVLKFLKERNSTKPFYIYLAPPVPHDPRVAAPEFMGRYAAKDIPLPATFLPLHPFDNGEMTVRDEALAPWPRTPEDTKQQLADYYACITGLDHHIGRIFAALKASGEWKNTVVIFTGDNGCSKAAGIPAMEAKGHYPSADLRGSKSDIFDGGHHLPFFVRWPGKVKAGSKSDQLICHTDLIATCAGLLGTKLPDNAGEDSVSLLPALLGTAKAPLHEAVVHHSIEGSFAIRQGNWKLELCADSGGWSAPVPGSPEAKALPATQLYDLSTDLAEAKNVQAEHPEVVAQLTKLLEKFIANGRSTLGAKQANDAKIQIRKKVKAVADPPLQETDKALLPQGNKWAFEPATLSDASLPRVLLIGDSICIGYKANVDVWPHPHFQSEKLNPVHDQGQTHRARPGEELDRYRTQSHGRNADG